MQLNGRISASFTRDTCTKLGMITSVEEIGLARSGENPSYTQVYYRYQKRPLTSVMIRIPAHSLHELASSSCRNGHIYKHNHRCIPDKKN